MPIPVKPRAIPAAMFLYAAWVNSLSAYACTLPAIITNDESVISILIPLIVFLLFILFPPFFLSLMLGM